MVLFKEKFVFKNNLYLLFLELFGNCDCFSRTIFDVESAVFRRRARIGLFSALVWNSPILARGGHFLKTVPVGVSWRSAVLKLCS